MEINPYNYESIAENIVNASNPIEAFSKIALDLDSNWKTTLAREVNKKLFIKHLKNSNIDSNIEFDVIEIDELHKPYTKITKKASLDFLDTYLEKVANMQDNYSINKEKTLYNDSAFDLELVERYERKFASGNGFVEQTEALKKEALDNSEAEYLKLKQKEKEELMYKKAALEAQYELELEKLAALPTNEHEQRSILEILVANDLEEEAEKVAYYGKYDVNVLSKIASDMDSDLFKKAMNIIGNIKKLKHAKIILPLGVGLSVGFGLKGYLNSSKTQNDRILGKEE